MFLKGKRNYNFFYLILVLENKCKDFLSAPKKNYAELGKTTPNYNSINK
jgi:hypothetical protein